MVGGLNLLAKEYYDISEGKEACCFHRKSPSDYYEDSCWMAGITPSTLAFSYKDDTGFSWARV
jgi:hypothetical protein